MDILTEAEILAADDEHNDPKEDIQEEKFYARIDE